METLRKAQKEYAERKAIEDRNNPVLTRETICGIIATFFQERHATYPNFRDSMTTAGGYGGTSNASCTIDLNYPDLISPTCPTDTQINIENSWTFEPKYVDGGWTTKEDTHGQFVMLPSKTDIMQKIGLNSLNRVSDLMTCLQYTFPTDARAVDDIRQKQLENVQKQHEKTQKTEQVRKIVGQLASELTTRLMESISTEMDKTIQLRNQDGAVESMSLREACRQFGSISMTETIRTNLGLHPSLMSAVTALDQRLQRLSLHL
jgi:hypothetical protein